MKTIDKYQFDEEKYTIQDGIQTFVATHTVLKRKFVLKMVNQGAKDEKDNYNYLIKEAQVLKKMVHPNIYKCHKLLRSKNNFYVIFDNIEGQTLQNLMKEHIDFDTSKDHVIIELLISKQIIQTLLSISDQNIAYLNLNPENIVVDKNYKIIFKNFGLSQEFQENCSSIDLVHFTGKINTYLPPQLEKGKVYSNTDAYSLGVFIDKLFQKEFQFGVKENTTTKSYKIKYQKEKINVDLNLSLLKDMADKLFIKNHKDRLKIIQTLKVKQEPLKPPTMDKTLTVSRKSFTNSPGKSINNSRMQKSFRENQSKMETKSTRSVSDIGERRELHLESVEDLVLLIIKKRNFSFLLLKMSEICLKNKEANLSTSLILGFLLAKKAALTISQLAKFVKQGMNKQMSISAKFKQYFQKTPAYSQLFSLTNKQMVASQHNFQQLLTKIKLLPTFSKNESLQFQVRYQRVNNSFLRRSILDFLLQLQLLSTEQYTNTYKENNSLQYLYLLSLMSDYETFEEMHEELFTEGLCGLQNEPFMKYMKSIKSTKVMELIESNSSNLFSEQNYRSPLAVKTTVTVKQ